MGSFNVSDSITGETIEFGDDVIVLVVDENQEFRKENKNGAILPIELYEPISLPLKGKYDDYGDISFEDQISYTILKDILDFDDWEDFRIRGLRKPFDGRSPVSYKGSKRTGFFGLSFFKESTWKSVSQAYIDIVGRQNLWDEEWQERETVQKNNYMEVIKDLYNIIHNEVDKNNGDIISGIKKLEDIKFKLNNPYYITSENKKIVLSGSMYGVLGYISECKCGSILPRYIRNTILSFDKIINGMDETFIGSILQSYDEMAKFVGGVEALGHHLVPSRYAGQDVNFDGIVGLSIAMMESSVGKMIEYDLSEEEVTYYEGIIKKIGEITNKINKKLEERKSDIKLYGR